MWFGLYVLKSAFWTIAVYHIFCLLPIIIWRRQLWRGSLKWPKTTDLAVLFATSIVFAAGAVALYKFLGDLFLDSQQTFELLIRLGYRKTSFIAMAIYFIFVNSALEELFWRGVIFNRLEQLRNPLKTIGIIWSFVAYAIFHYPIMRLVIFPGYGPIRHSPSGFIRRRTGAHLPQKRIYHSGKLMPRHANGFHCHCSYLSPIQSITCRDIAVRKAG